jgi:lipid II:glycine glycyltransferase (peptidoglycan interpeptide bridge formation enzyme)
MWNQQNEAIDLSAFQCAVRALRNEYVCRRGLILRILPLLHDYNSNLYIDILQKEGYSHALKRDRERTLILDIRAPTEELRKKLDQKWRNCLNKAERNQLELVEGTDDELFAEFISIYQDLLRRKNFPEPNNIREFRIIQQALPSELKMRIFLCRSNGFSSAGVICSAIGQTGIYLFGATNDQGMTNKASYLLQWRAIQWMREEGCQYYNLNGINPLINPGTYHFKAGLSGKNGKDVRYIGHFDSYSGWINAALIRAAEPLYPIVKKVLVRRLQLGESKRM